MSAWYYEAQYAKNFLGFQISHKDVLNLFGLKEKEYEKCQQEDPQLFKMIKAM